MQNKINQYIDVAMALRQRRRKTARNLCALALLVALGIFWQMRITGIAMSDEACCGKPEHTHTEACLGEKQLVCGYPEESEISQTPVEPQLNCQLEAHSHGDACYTTQQVLVCGEDHEHTDACYTQEKVLTCEKPEHIHDTSCWEPLPEPHVHTETCYEQSYICGLEAHTHTTVCYSDPNADLETARDWEDTLPKPLEENRAKALVSIALSQIGYRESEDNFVLDEDGTSIKGITRYGQWYGNPYGEWDAMFVSFCLHYAGVEEEELPYNSGSYAWSVQLREKDVLLHPGSSRPDSGDLIFFDTDGDEKADHVGIAAGVEAEILTVIEGGRENCVDSYEYALDDPSIYAFVSIPASVDLAPEQRVSVVAVEIYEDASWQTPLEGGSAVTVTGVLPEGICAKAFPVPLEMEGQEVLWAYDIRLFTPDGELWEPEGDTLTVRVETPQLLEQELPGLVSVYHISEDGGRERIPSSREGDSLNFAVPHFSVYAAAKAIANGVTSESGLLAQFANGESAILEGDFTVYSPIPVEGRNLVLDLNGHTLTVSKGHSLFQISGNGSLTIIDSGINGASSVTYKVTETYVTDQNTGATQEEEKTYFLPASGKIVGGDSPIITVSGGTFTLESGAMCNGTGRAIDMTVGTANLSGGSIYGFQKTGDVNTKDENFGGAVRATGGTLNISGTVLANNSAPNGGAIYANNTTVNITGGVISGNTATRKVVWGDHSENAPYRCGGGGIYTDGNTRLTMSGGYITNNEAVDSGYFDGGGGVLFGGTTVFTLNGGFITGNVAAGGGGIRSDWKRETTFVMNGGFVSGNTAETAEGGGIAITSGGKGEINGGYITNNRIIKTEHWGGGGLFCSDGAYLRVYHVLVTENSAGGFGGGVAGCSTGRVYICVKDGGAIYQNTASGTNLSDNGSQKNEDHTYGKESPVFMENGYADYFCALNSLVEGSMLGDGTANWSGSMDGVPVSNVAKNEVLEAAYVMGLTSNPSPEDISNAQEAAKVFINGNSSYTHGGGILCNGYLLVGDKNPIAVGSRLILNGTKALTGGNLAEYDFTFQVTDEEGNEVSIGKTNKSGNITFDRLLSFTEELCSLKITENLGTAEFQYYLKEVADPSYPEITVDNTQYKIAVTIQREDKDLPLTDENDHLIARAYYKITHVTVQQSSDGGISWTNVSYDFKPSNDEQHAGSLKITNNTTFTNEKGKTTSLSVKKKWLGEDGQSITDNLPEFITVDLLKDGDKFGESVVLNAENGWYYTWPNLPYGPTYTVKEHPVPGYETSIAYPETNGGGYWVPADSLLAEEQYIIVSPDGDQSLFITENHQDNAFDTNDKRAVVPQTGTLELGGQTYSTWYKAEDIQNRSIFTALTSKKGSNPGIVLKSNGASAGTWLLVQNSGGNYLKSTSGKNYASFFTYEDGVLKGQDGFNWNPDNLRNVIYTNSKFNTSQSTGNTAKLYKFVESESIITITNTKKSDYYGFDLLKVDSGNHDIVLPGAEFQLTQGDTVCKFTLTDGVYLYDENGEDMLTTDENGKLHVDGLPAGTYTLVETKAPEGYELSAESREIVLPTEGGQTLQITVENDRITYVLPETGGSGVAPLIFMGLLFMAVPVIAYKRKI